MNKRYAVLAIIILLSLVYEKAAVTAQTSVTARGKKIYNNQCALCHGIDGVGGRGPALNQPKLARAVTATELFKLIKDGIPGTEMPDFWTLSDVEIRQVSAYARSLGRLKPVRIPGYPVRGKALYETKGNCSACHIVRGEGGVTGPELTEIGLRRSPAHLLQAILDPNAAVPDGFLVVGVVTSSDQRLRGVRVNEDSFTIQLRDSAGRVHSFFKSELRELKKEIGVSTMPAYKGVFTDAELDDLVAYLAGLRGGK